MYNLRPLFIELINAQVLGMHLFCSLGFVGLGVF